MEKSKSWYEHIGHCLGQAIVSRRKRLNMSQEDLAEKSGVDRAFISSIERSKRNPSFKTMASIAHGLRMRFARLVDNSERCADDKAGEAQ
jgi:putative transcriptional regulator